MSLKLPELLIYQRETRFLERLEAYKTGVAINIADKLLKPDYNEVSSAIVEASKLGNIPIYSQLLEIILSDSAVFKHLPTTSPWNYISVFSGQTDWSSEANKSDRDRWTQDDFDLTTTQLLTDICTSLAHGNTNILRYVLSISQYDIVRHVKDAVAREFESKRNLFHTCCTENKNFAEICVTLLDMHPTTVFRILSNTREFTAGIEYLKHSTVMTTYTDSVERFFLTLSTDPSGLQYSEAADFLLYKDYVLSHYDDIVIEGTKKVFSIPPIIALTKQFYPETYTEKFLTSLDNALYNNNFSVKSLNSLIGYMPKDLRHGVSDTHVLAAIQACQLEDFKYCFSLFDCINVTTPLFDAIVEKYTTFKNILITEYDNSSLKSEFRKLTNGLHETLDSPGVLKALFEYIKHCPNFFDSIYNDTPGVLKGVSESMFAHANQLAASEITFAMFISLYSANTSRVGSKFRIEPVDFSEISEERLTEIRELFAAGFLCSDEDIISASKPDSTKTTSALKL